MKKQSKKSCGIYPKDGHFDPEAMVLTLDLATHTGWALMDLANKKIRDSGVIDFSLKNFSIGDIKLHQIDEINIILAKWYRNNIEYLMASNPNKPLIVLIEYSQFGFKYNIAKVSMLLSLIMNYLCSVNENIIWLKTIIPGTWRKMYKGMYSNLLDYYTNSNGNVNWKQLALEVVNKEYESTKNDNQAEAILMAISFAYGYCWTLPEVKK